MSDFTLHCGDAIQVLKTFPDESVQCCITSSPYWGLRDYGTPPQIWGGSSDCKHDWNHERWYAEQSAGSDSISAFSQAGPGNAERLKKARWREADTCQLCGAWRGSLGLEPTPEMFVGHLVDVFREVKRVLKPSGLLWCNLGDSYARNPGKGGSGPNGKHDFIPDYGLARKAMRRGSGRADGIVTDQSPRNRDGAPPCDLPEKNLIGIPWRVAFALQADGWILRRDIIFSKVNPMPESCQDRCTTAHEYLFMLAKQARYFYDADAIREPNSSPEQLAHNLRYAKPCGQPGNVNNVGIHSRPGAEGRNKRSVWTISSQPYPDAHFAVMPEALVEPCILAGTRPGDLVLDPFCGAGTVGAVSLLHSRNFIGIDLNPEYLKMARARLYCASSPLLGDREITQEIAI